MSDKFNIQDGVLISCYGSVFGMAEDFCRYHLERFFFAFVAS